MQNSTGSRWRSVTAISLLVVTVLGCAPCGAGEAVITGHILDQSGKVPRQAHAVLFNLQTREPTAIVRADDHGRFSIEVRDGALSIVRLVAVGSVYIDVPVFPARGEQIEVTAQLMPKAYFGDTHIVWLRQMPNKAWTQLERNSGDGWRGIISGSKDAVRISMECALQSLDYVDADDYELDASSYRNYISVLRKVRRHREITVSRQGFPRRLSAAKIKIKDGTGITASLVAISTEYQSYAQTHLEGMQLLSTSATAPPRLGAWYLRPEWYVTLEGQDEPFKQQLESEQHPLVRELLARTLMHFHQMQSPERQRRNAQQVEQWLADIPIGSPLWNGFPAGNTRYNDDKMLARLIAVHHESLPVREYFFRFLRNESVNEDLRRYVAVRALRFMENDEIRFIEFYRRITSEFSETKLAAQVQEQFAAKFTREALKPGSLAPTFSVRDLRDRSAIFSSESLRGKVYLIDFWATWCGWCVKGLPELQAWYDRYKSKGFEIVSFSPDETEHVIRDFQAKRFPMPWPNVWVGKGSGQEEVVKLFGVKGYPFHLLVDEAGKVIMRGDGGLSTSDIGRKLREKFGY